MRSQDHLTAPALPSLTGLRFAAALSVFALHVGVLLTPTSLAPIASLTALGRIGVTFFFLLSGFILTWAQPGRDSLREFARRRFARVYPVHMLTLLLAIPVGIYEGTRPGVLNGLLQLFLLQAWIPRPSVHFSYNVVAWSLSCEAFFYFTFPFLLRVALRLSSNTRQAAVLMLVCVSAAWAILVLSGHPGVTRQWAVFVFPVARLPEFVIGMLLALELKGGHLPHVPVWAASTAVGLAYLVGSRLPVGVWASLTSVTPFALLIVAFAQHDAAGGSSIFSSRRARHLGAWSYAFYAIHNLIVRVFLHALGSHHLGAFAALIAIAGLLIGSVLASAVIFTGVEHPLERVLRSGSLRRFSRTRT